MIPYKLVKELKDAGFPLIEMVDEHPSYPSCMRCGHPYVVIDGKNYLEPNLNVLIDACGEELQFPKFVLWKEKKWEAGYFTQMYEETWLEPCGKGDTKEEAVAKLWLKLKVGK